jgi:PAS domain S-box-containing protein
MILADGQSLYLNKASEQMLGLSPAQLNGPQESFADALHPDDRTRVLSLRRESLSWHQELNAEYRLFHRNGTLVYCYDHAVPVFDEKGEFIRLDGIIINVTAQKELQEKNLQAQELETLGMISSRLAHELRNPLTSIGGLARRIIKSFGENDNRAEKGQLILDQVQKLEKILNMMLAYIEPRKISLKPGDLNQVILRALRELEEKYKTPGFSVTTTLAENLETIPLDEEVLEKVFVSLLENARFRMGQNGVLELSTRQNRGMVVLTLTFQVPRITDDDLEHYFFPFTIDYSSVKTAPLSELADVSLPKIMIHKHGGKISVAKDEARRITITISLPTG